MANPLALLAIGLVLGGGIGFAVAAANGVTLDGHDHADLAMHAGAAHTAAAHAGAAHDHAPSLPALSIPAGPDAPWLAATLTPDTVGGWNLRLDLRNFRFAPENVGRANVAGEGHAHVYVGGEKLARLYGPWLHIPVLPEGAPVEVTLNANDHGALAVAGRPLRVTARRRPAPPL